MNPSPTDVTLLLTAWCKGDESTLHQLAPIVEAELRRLARARLSKKSPGHTLQPTALMNEVYLRLIEWKAVEWQDRAHFFAVAPKIIRRVLVNQAMARNRQKRSGDAGPHRRPTRTRRSAGFARKIDTRKSRLVELRFFGGLSAEETAEVLQISLRTVHREWDLAPPGCSGNCAAQIPETEGTATRRFVRPAMQRLVRPGARQRFELSAAGCEGSSPADHQTRAYRGQYRS
jgi:RNA polymerase sigma-70 factor (ECF subfamily)